MPREVETKFADVDHDALRRRLQALGACRRHVVFEDNAVWDTPDKMLKQKGQLLRIRQALPGHGQAGGCLLTFKAPTSDGSAVLKVVEEHETAVADAAALRQVLAGLGYVEAFRYQKLRETWELGGVLCLLDLLPFGSFLELEGPAEAFVAVCEALGLDLAAGTNQTYHALNLAHLHRAGRPPQDSFIFSDAEARRLQAIAASA
ncbi:class IV adenylate cyclase [Megalodesulfovibrio paquesii]